MSAAPVLIIGNFLSASGSNRSVGEELAERLADSGFPVITASARIGRAARLADMLDTAWCGRGHYDVAQVDVFSGAAFVWADSVCWLLRKMHKPYVLVLRGGALPEFAIRHSGRVRRLLSGAAEVTSPSPYLADAMARYRRGVRIVPNGLALERYPFRPRTKPLPRLVWLRAFHETYNPPLAVQVLRLLSDRFGATDDGDSSGAAPFLTMYGPDKKDGSLQVTIAAATALRVHHRLRIAGPVAKSSVPECLQAGDIFLNTSDFDNTPVSVIEAMACGLCVVSTNVGGIPQLLSHGENALLVPPRDPEAMADAVAALLREPERATRISANGRLTARTYDWANILPQWHRVLRSAAGAGGSG